LEEAALAILTQSNIKHMEKYDEEVTVGRLWCRQSSNPRIVVRNILRERATALLAATQSLNIRNGCHTRAATKAVARKRSSGAAS
jgi:hypothetical protein